MGVARAYAGSGSFGSCRVVREVRASALAPDTALSGADPRRLAAAEPDLRRGARAVPAARLDSSDLCRNSLNSERLETAEPCPPGRAGLRPLTFQFAMFAASICYVRNYVDPRRSLATDGFPEW